MNKRMSITLVLVLLIGSLLTACGGAPAPVTFDQLPVFTGATATTNATLNDAMTAQLEKTKAAGQVKAVEGKVYDVPADTTWDAVSSFYKTALEKAGWTVAQSGDNLLAFSRGKQAFVLNYTAGVLIAVLTEEK
jgi:hypothetical protein